MALNHQKDFISIINATGHATVEMVKYYGLSPLFVQVKLIYLTMIKPKAGKFISHTIFSVLVLIMSGCGGGNSNSGGSSNTFIGTQEVSISQSRITSNSRTTGFELSRGENQITISDRDFTISAQLSGSSFTVTSPNIPILNPQPGSGCSSFSVTYSGTITDTMVMGTISGATDCLLPASISGSFEASNQTNSMQATVASIASIIVL